ncbi:MAG: DegV family EDD domain-containing protein [Caldilineaceae bacterium]|nr:DegV family EDD domain-containing protein [Caldilineaceae bacterium]
MNNVRIVTDSNVAIAPELIERHQIRILPHLIKANGKISEEQPDYGVEALFAQLPPAAMLTRDQLPLVLPADLNSIVRCYQQVAREAEQIVSIHLSSQLSPMWNMARRAAEMLKGRYTIRVIDSMSASYGLGILVEMAAEAAARGAPVHEIARLVNGAVPHLYLSVFSESLNYLERSAHLSGSQSILGTLLGIKAMLMMEEGKFHPLEKVQTREEVVDKLFEFVGEFAHVERVGIMQHMYADERETLTERLRELLPNATIQAIPYPPSLAVHLGPNMLGVVVYEGA